MVRWAGWVLVGGGKIFETRRWALSSKGIINVVAKKRSITRSKCQRYIHKIIMPLETKEIEENNNVLV